MRVTDEKIDSDGVKYVNPKPFRRIGASDRDLSSFLYSLGL